MAARPLLLLLLLLPMLLFSTTFASRGGNSNEREVQSTVRTAVDLSRSRRMLLEMKSTWKNVMYDDEDEDGDEYYYNYDDDVLGDDDDDEHGEHDYMLRRRNLLQLDSTENDAMWILHSAPTGTRRTQQGTSLWHRMFRGLLRFLPASRVDIAGISTSRRHLQQVDDYDYDSDYDEDDDDDEDNDDPSSSFQQLMSGNNGAGSSSSTKNNDEDYDEDYEDYDEEYYDDDSGGSSSSGSRDASTGGYAQYKVKVGADGRILGGSGPAVMRAQPPLDLDEENPFSTDRESSGNDSGNNGLNIKYGPPPPSSSVTPSSSSVTSESLVGGVRSAFSKLSKDQQSSLLALVASGG